jgi:hypothetical protein
VAQRPPEAHVLGSPLRQARLSTGVVHGVDAADQIAEPWDALADRVGAAPFLRAGWIAAWWRAFGQGRLEIITASRGGTLRAVLPLIRHRLTTSSPTNWHTPRFGVLAEGSAARTVVLNELFSQPSHLVSLGFLLDRDPDLEAARAAAETARRRVFVRTLEHSPTVVVRGDRSTYERSLSRVCGATSDAAGDVWPSSARSRWTSSSIPTGSTGVSRRRSPWRTPPGRRNAGPRSPRYRTPPRSTRGSHAGPLSAAGCA